MFVRDQKTNALINNEDSYYKTILLRRKERQDTQSVIKELACVKDELAKMKNLVNILLAQRALDGTTNDATNT